MTENIYNEDNFLSNVIFSDKGTFHLPGTVNRHNVRVWGLENPHETIEHARGSPKLNVFCALSAKNVLRALLFLGTDHYRHCIYWQMELWLKSQLEEGRGNTLFFQQNGAPPHFHRNMTQFLNNRLSGRRTGRGGQTVWPPRSPDLTSLDLFLEGRVKDTVYTPTRNSKLAFLMRVDQVTCKCCQCLEWDW
jgi:hypothetical protein